MEERAVRHSRNRAGSRAAILEAAERVFAEHGLSGARTDAIAAAAGVNKALLYYYFPSKDALFYAVLDASMKGFRVSALQILSQNGPAAPILFQYVGTHFDFIGAHPYYPRLFQRLMLAGGRWSQRLVDEHLLPVARALNALLRRGMRAGEFRALDATHTAISLVALTVFYFSAAPVIQLVSGRDPFSAGGLRRRKAEVRKFIQYALLTNAESVR
jgi:TetR/AcrR family transcriptional regulator